MPRTGSQPPRLVLDGTRHACTGKGHNGHGDLEAALGAWLQIRDRPDTTACTGRHPDTTRVHNQYIRDADVCPGRGRNQHLVQTGRERVSKKKDGGVSRKGSQPPWRAGRARSRSRSLAPNTGSRASGSRPRPVSYQGGKRHVLFGTGHVVNATRPAWIYFWGRRGQMSPHNPQPCLVWSAVEVRDRAR